LACNFREGVAALLTQDEELSWFLFVSDCVVFPEVIVTPAITVKVSPLFLVLREKASSTSAYPSRSASGQPCRPSSKDLPNTSMQSSPLGDFRVVSIPITVGVFPLERVAREGVKRIGDAVQGRSQDSLGSGFS
jgi:hypothetical protein